MRSMSQALNELQVGDIMQCSVSTVTADSSVSEVARVFWDRHISGAPVTAQDGRLIGVVSAADIMRARGYGVAHRSSQPGPTVAALGQARPGAPAANGSPGTEPTAADIMTPALFSVRVTTTVVELAQFLVRAGVHRALVLDGERLLGIVTTSDIVQALADASAIDANEPLSTDRGDLEC